MLIFDITKTGHHYLTLQHKVVGGVVIIFVGIIAFVVGYFSLSPFSKFRRFFEGGFRKRE